MTTQVPHLSRRTFLCRGACLCAGITGLFDLSTFFGAGPLRGDDDVLASAKLMPPKIGDALTIPAPGSVTLNSYFANRIQLGVDHHLTVLDYTKLVDYFRHPANPFAEGEFWGKTVRSVCLTYQYNHDPKLKAILDATVADLLSTQTPDGCISTHTYPKQPKGGDLWERKYVLLGLLRYYEIDPKPEVLSAMVRLADYTIGQIGPAPKTPIGDTGYAFQGIESSSILEPMMKLYQLTGYSRYLDFGHYIVEEAGGCKRANIFEELVQGTAPKDIASNGNPKQSIAKAYETMSCFEGLVEYYRATGNDQWRQAAANLQNGIRDREITIIGGGGGDQPYNLGLGRGEQWNDTAFEQTNPTMTKMMETCVTVTWMKFCLQILRLTGDSRVADQMELSLYNALAGAQKPTGNYYDYFQKLDGIRGGKPGYTHQVGTFTLSCCTANGPMGLALAPTMAVMESSAGAVVNFYCFDTARIKTPAGAATLRLETDYPKTGQMRLHVEPPRAGSTFTLGLRIPEWSRQTTLKINGQPQDAPAGKYAQINRAWSPGDIVDLTLDMRGRLLPAPHGSNRGGDDFVALAHGPLILARDVRLGGDIDQPVAVKTDKNLRVDTQPADPAPFAQITLKVPTEDGGSFPMIDYASAGNTWAADSHYVTWMPCPAAEGGDLVPAGPFAPHATEGGESAPARI